MSKRKTRSQSAQGGRRADNGDTPAHRASDVSTINTSKRTSTSPLQQKTTKTRRVTDKTSRTNLMNSFGTQDATTGSTSPTNAGMRAEVPSTSSSTSVSVNASPGNGHDIDNPTLANATRSISHALVLDVVVECGACGELGHLRNDTRCPQFEDGNNGDVRFAGSTSSDATRSSGGESTVDDSGSPPITAAGVVGEDVTMTDSDPQNSESTAAETTALHAMVNDQVPFFRTVKHNQSVAYLTNKKDAHLKVNDKGRIAIYHEKKWPDSSYTFIIDEPKVNYSFRLAQTITAQRGRDQLVTIEYHLRITDHFNKIPGIMYVQDQRQTLKIKSKKNTAA
jgi:hypothetical protein